MTEVKATIDAEGIYYRELNEQIRRAVASGVMNFEIINVKGQRYIGTGLSGNLKFRIVGTPGQDTGAFMDGPHIKVEGNAQDGLGNTMEDGVIAVNGQAGDVLGYGMRGGKIFVRGDVGYRVGIHMKAYKEKQPLIVIGGKAGDFLGEYMAGGTIILLGAFSQRTYAPLCGRSLGTGMYGGAIYVRGEIPEEQLDPNLSCEPPDDEDMCIIRDAVTGFCGEFSENFDMIMAKDFRKITPFSHRPYAKLYCPI